MSGATAVLQPLLVVAGIRTDATAVIGTVKGDLHDIGKNLVSMMWKGANFDVIDLGTNVSPERFVAAAVRAADLAGTKVVIGGAPVHRVIRRRYRGGRVCAGRRPGGRVGQAASGFQYVKTADAPALLDSLKVEVLR